jgi:hypothetical protein
MLPRLILAACLAAAGCRGHMLRNRFPASPEIVTREWILPRGLPEQLFWAALPIKLGFEWNVSSVDTKEGRAETEWRVLAKCWGGLFGGFSAPCQQAQATFELERSEPRRLTITVLQQEALGKGEDRWKDVGSNPKLEEEILSALNAWSKE